MTDRLCSYPPCATPFPAKGRGKYCSKTCAIQEERRRRKKPGNDVFEKRLSTEQMNAVADTLDPAAGVNSGYTIRGYTQGSVGIKSVGRRVIK